MATAYHDPKKLVTQQEAVRRARALKAAKERGGEIEELAESFRLAGFTGDIKVEI